MADTVTKAEAQLIAQEATEKALEKYAKHLPDIMKPVMFEVSEIVARRSDEGFNKLFTLIFGADVKDQNHLRDLHKDLFYLRDQRVAYDDRRKVVRQEILRASIRWVGTCAVSAAAAVLLLLGINPPPHP